MSEYLVAVTDNRHGNYELERAILAECGARLVINNCVTAMDVAQCCAEADALLLDMAPLPAAAVRALTRCKIVNRYGVGYDNVDVNACTERGIWVTNVPDYCAEDVSDHAVALLLSCLRKTALRDRLVRQHQWNIPAGGSARVTGKTLGVLGAGRIARALIRKLSGFGLARVLVYDPYISAETLAPLGCTKADFDTVMSESDFISLHMPVTEETRGMINARALALVKPTAILINTGRGPLVDDHALLAALQTGRLAAAGLDTHNTEPLPADSPFCGLDNVVLTDHTAYSTVESMRELKMKSAQNIAAVLRGQSPNIR